MIEQFLFNIAKRGGEKLETKSEHSALRGLNDRWKAARDAAEGFTDQAAKGAWMEHQKELAAALAGGNMHAMDAWSRTDFEQDFQEKLEACKSEMRRATAEAIPVASTICERFCAVANQVAADTEAAEAAQHAEYGIPYRQSDLVTWLKKSAEISRARVPVGSQYANTSPAAMLPYIDLSK